MEPERAVTPRVSLIIATFNHAHLLSQAVESGLAQTLAEVEIIVVDDGSTDDTPAVLARYGDRICCKRQENRGLAAARNAGLAMAHGSFIAFLDADDVLASTKLAEQTALLESDDRVGWTYCDVWIDEEATGESIAASERFAYGRRRLSGWLFAELLHGNFIPAIAPLIRRSALDAVGGFDEGLTALEDWDLWLRLALVAEARYVPALLATYHVRRDGMSQDRARMDRNRFSVLDKVSQSHRDAIDALGRPGRRILADMHNWYGYDAYGRGDWSVAIQRLAASVRTHPWQGRAPMLLGVSLLRGWLL